MIKIPSPPAIVEYVSMGGTLEIALFDDADGNLEEIVAAIAGLVDKKCEHFASGRQNWQCDAERLTQLGGRPVNVATFFGDYLDTGTGDLRAFGAFQTPRSREVLRNPPFKMLDRASPVYLKVPPPFSPERPEPGSGGNFAYAFMEPVHGLEGPPSRIQRVFDDVREAILPSGTQSRILDWANPALPRVSPYFEAGMEWWGVYLFSIYVPALRRLTIIAGSETD